MTDAMEYVFLRHLRKGLGACATTPASGGARAKLEVSLELSSDQPLAGMELPKEFQLLGPGDVLGFDARVVARTEPRNHVGDFEPNYFPFVEFAEPDFPWRFTAEPPDANGRLHPWIVLVVLLAEDQPDGTKKEFTETRFAGKVPCVANVNVSSLPDLTNSWRWAHVQATVAKNEEIAVLLGSSPERVVSRLMCPRRLRPGAKYVALVVPATKLGLCAALGEDPGSSDDASTPAWPASDGPLKFLPYYYRWEFRTGQKGDFEQLVRLLRPHRLDKLGLRPIDCSSPGCGASVTFREGEGAQGALSMEGALMATGTEFTPWGADADWQPDALFLSRLKEVLNQPKADIASGNTQPVVVPPIYGRWHRGVDAVQTLTKEWIHALNLDPRHRAAAGLGAEVVRRQQEALMAEAWRQLGDIQAVNETLRRAQFGREVTKQAEARLGSFPDAEFLRVTRGLHSRVKLPTQKNTVFQTVADSRIGTALLDPALQKVLRKRGAIRKRQRPDLLDRGHILDRINEGRSSLPPPSAECRGLGTPEGVTFRLEHMRGLSIASRPDPRGEGRFSYECRYSHFQQGTKLVVDVKTDPEASWLQKQEAPGRLTLGGIPTEGKLSVTISVAEAETVGKVRRRVKQQFMVVTGKVWRTSPGGPAGTLKTRYRRPARQARQQKVMWQVVDFRQELLTESKDGYKRFDERQVTSDLAKEIFKSWATSTEDKARAEQLRLALTSSRFLNASHSSKTPPASRPPAVIPDLAAQMKAELSAERTVARAALGRLKSSPLRPRKSEPDRELDPVMAAPEFPQPMYEALAELSPDHVLPGLDQVPRNTVSLLKTNRRFLEAFLCGMNHEFAGELLWREYPTDQRGSYFRQFWPRAEADPTPSDRNSYLRMKGLKPWLKWEPSEKAQLVEIYGGRFLGSEGLPEAVVDALASEEAGKDIDPVHTWRADLSKNKQDQGGENLDLVLLIRGDLLKKYPNTIIYAVKKDRKHGGPALTEFGTRQEDMVDPFPPSFSGSLQPDLAFVGFKLNAKDHAEVLNGYFVLEERVTECRFGFDESAGGQAPDISGDWSNLAWIHLQPGTPSPPKYDWYADALKRGASQVDPGDWSDGSGVAWRTFQKPVRIVIAASELLPQAAPDKPSPT